jgi:hypothetical protein
MAGESIITRDSNGKVVDTCNAEDVYNRFHKKRQPTNRGNYLSEFDKGNVPLFPDGEPTTEITRPVHETPEVKIVPTTERPDRSKDIQVPLDKRPKPSRNPDNNAKRPSAW